MERHGRCRVGLRRPHGDRPHRPRLPVGRGERARHAPGPGARRRCCAAFRDTLRAPWPNEIGFTSIYSRSDGAVPWRSSHDPYAENVVVDSNHVAQLTSAAIQRAVAQALAGRLVATPAAAVA